MVRIVRELDATQLQEVVDGAGGAVCLGDHSSRQPVHHFGILLRVEGLREKSEGADGGLEFVGDVGHEVPPHSLGAAGVGPVLDDRKGAGSMAIRERVRRHLEQLCRRAEEIDRLMLAGAVAGVGQQSPHAVLHECVPVTGCGESRGGLVAVRLLASPIDDDNPVLDPLHSRCQRPQAIHRAQRRLVRRRVDGLRGSSGGTIDKPGEGPASTDGPQGHGHRHRQQGGCHVPTPLASDLGEAARHTSSLAPCSGVISPTRMPVMGVTAG